MKIAVGYGVVFLLALGVFIPFSGIGTPAVLGQAGNDFTTVEAQRSFVNTYCLSCHNTRLASGGLSWEALDIAQVEKNPELSERVIRKVRSGMMPPAGSPHPDVARRKAFAAAIENRLDKVSAGQPHTGAPELHRLNRTEYRNAVRDMLGLEVDLSDLLPPDNTTNGFDNMSESLTITPALMGAYIRASEKISRDALGDPDATPTTVQYKVSRLANQMRHVDGTPFGTRGGTSVLHTFPADGEYSFKVILYYDYPGELVGSALPVQLQGQEVEISVDGARVAAVSIDPTVKESEANYVTVAVKLAAGQHRLAAAFVAKFDGPVQDQYRQLEQSLLDTTITGFAEITGLPHLQSFSVTGPFKPSGVSDSASRRRILTCKPAQPADEKTCATQIISNLARKAFRRPVTAEDLESLTGYYDLGRKAGTFDAGIRTAIQAVLVKPEFIFRLEDEPATAAPGTVYRLNDLELASRLAFFLWSTGPDDELIATAAAGKLRSPGVLEKQVQRMLSDPRSEALSRNFAGQWLRLAGLQQVFPEALIFPNFSSNLATAMRREVELLFDNIMRGDRDVVELLTADYTFVDETLARHYGIPGITGTRFKRVQLTDPNRFGLLGKAGVLTMTSLANRTSPVQRGKYLLEVLLGTPPPPPPPVVPKLKESVDNQKVLSVRERMEAHRANPACNSCHKIMDPIGMALENFDAVGVWRRTDGGSPINPAGELFDGTKLDGPVAVRQAAVDRSELFLGNFTQNLLAYGVGRVADYRDMSVVRSIVRDAAANKNHFSSYVLGIVKSPPFQMRTVRQTPSAK